MWAFIYTLAPGPTSVRGGSIHKSYFIKLLNIQMKSHTLSKVMYTYHRSKMFTLLSSKYLYQSLCSITEWSLLVKKMSVYMHIEI